MRVGIRTEDGGLIAAETVNEISLSTQGKVIARTPSSSSVVARPAAPGEPVSGVTRAVPAQQLVMELYRAIRECDEADNPFLFIAYSKEKGTWQIFDATEEATKADNHAAHIGSQKDNRARYAG